MAKKLQLLTDIPALSLTVDPTLTKPGDAADARAVGDALKTTVKSVNGNVPDDLGNVEIEIKNGVDFRTDETLSLKNGVLSVNTAQEPDPDNTLPITSAAVHTTVGNIEILLATI